MDDSQSAISGTELRAQSTDVNESVSTEELDESLSLKVARFLRLCWGRRRSVIGILVTGILVSVLYALSLPNVYRSTTTLLPPDNSSSYSGLMSMLSGSSAAGLGSEALGLETPGELFIAILESRNVQDSLIKRLDLVHYYKKKFSEDTRRSLAGDTSVVQDRKSGIITISVTAVNPVIASNIAQGYVVELNRVLSDDSTSAARRERIFLEERLKCVKQDLDDSAKALSQFSTKSGAIDVPAQAKSMMDAGLKLETDLIDSRSQLAALRQTYSEDNPKVRSVEARNAELQRQIDKLSGLHQEPGSKVGANKSEFSSVSQLPNLGLTYYDLERKMRVEEALWETLTKQYEAAKVDEAKQIPTVRVLDVANVPERKSLPSRRSIVIVGTILSLITACISVFAGTIWNEMDAEEEPKKLIVEIADAALDRRHWYWSLPGIRGFRNRLGR